jgi:lipopolysaccharide biosynthesis glycosyltransferase
VSGSQVNVVMCVDRGFTLPLAVALASMHANNPVGSLVVHILHSDIPAETKERIAAPLRGTTISWVDIDRHSLAGVHHSDFLSDATLYRLLLSELLSVETRRVLYIDADIISVGPLAELFELDLKGHVLGAVRDANAPWAAGPAGAAWRELGMDPSSPYFNAGVLLIDTPRWRRDRVGEQSLELLRREKPRWGDQDALNKVIEGRWLELPRRWNLQTGELTGNGPAWALWRDEVESAVADPSIIHFTGRDKPWQWGTSHPRADEWYRWLDRTHWAEWRPIAPKSGRVETLLRVAARRYRAARSNAREQLPN